MTMTIINSTVGYLHKKNFKKYTQRILKFSTGVHLEIFKLEIFSRYQAILRSRPEQGEHDFRKISGKFDVFQLFSYNRFSFHPLPWLFRENRPCASARGVLGCIVTGWKF